MIYLVDWNLHYYLDNEFLLVVENELPLLTIISSSSVTISSMSPSTLPVAMDWASTAKRYYISHLKIARSLYFLPQKWMSFNIFSLPLRYSIVSSSDFLGFLYNLKRSELATTDTELIAIAADPIQGCSINPSGLKTPAATGIPTIL